MRCGGCHGESPLISKDRTSSRTSSKFSTSLLKSVQEHDLIRQVTDEIPLEGALFLHDQVKSKGELQAPGILCCCGEATPALVGTALSNGHRIPTEEAAAVPEDLEIEWSSAEQPLPSKRPSEMLLWSDASADNGTRKSTRVPTQELFPIVLDGTEPNSESHRLTSKSGDRVVLIQRDFDEYDPQSRTTSVKSHDGHVLRSRRKRRLKTLESDADSLTSSTSSRSLFSTIEHEPEDAITNWAVLVGKALWCYMKGAGQVGQRQKLGLVSAAFNIGFGRCRDAKKSYESKSDERTVPKQGGKGALRRANAVVSQLQELVKRVGKEEADILHADWDEDALSFLFSADYADSLMILAGGASWVVREDETVVQASQPCRVFGDIHGQLRDLLMFFHAFGLPAKTGTSFVFNGDFVDRGAHQLEVIGVLFALKIVYPKQIFLVRGNHEDSGMNRKYGFFDACREKLGSFGEKAFNLVQKAFEWLPLACLIEGKVLTVHGGIGDGKWTIDELACVKRPLNADEFDKKSNRWLYNILWSDPIPDDDGGTNLFGVHSSPRTASAVQFGWNITKTFCALNGIDVIVRSHQCLEDGAGFEVMHDQHLVRVFSARDYEEHRNDASIISIFKEKSENSSEKNHLVLRMHSLRSITKTQGQM